MTIACHRIRFGEMSDDFNHAADAVDRLLNGEGEEEGELGWSCSRCGAVNPSSVRHCLGCGGPEREFREADPDIFSL